MNHNQPNRKDDDQQATPCLIISQDLNTKPTTVIFPKRYKQRFYQLVSSLVSSQHCPYCGRLVVAKNFAGAGPIEELGDQRYMWDNCFERHFYPLFSDSLILPATPLD